MNQLNDDAYLQQALLQLQVLANQNPRNAEQTRLLQEADAILQAREDALFNMADDDNEAGPDATDEELRVYVRQRCERVVQEFPLTPAHEQALQQRAGGAL